MVKKIAFSILSVCIGLLFLYSAYTKIYSLESFEGFQYTIVEYVHIPWFGAIIGSRLLIGMEAALGLLMLIHFYGRSKWVVKTAFGLTIIFSIYLIYLWAAVGNDVNCGCFGDAIWMSPSSSLVKNVLILLVLLLIMRYHSGIRFKISEWITWGLMLALTITPFFVYPLPNDQPQWLNKGRYKIDLAALYTPGKADAPKVDLNKGKHVIAFLSLKCPHCKMAAKKMHIMMEKNPALPFHIVLGGNDKYLAAFWKETKAQNIPYTQLKADEFTAIAGYSWPAIYLVNNGMVEAETNYISMDQAQIENWLKKP